MYYHHNCPCPLQVSLVAFLSAGSGFFLACFEYLIVCVIKDMLDLVLKQGIVLNDAPHTDLFIALPAFVARWSLR